MMKLFGGIEAGGTKFVCAVGTGPGHILAESRFPTTTPEETLGLTLDFFRHYPDIQAIGIASFGPVDPNPNSPTFGYITSTPKPYWAQTDLVGPIQQAFKVPIGFDTDVNGAALAEYQWGAGQGLNNIIYLTIGTGIGGGAIINGQLVHGLLHPEMGHMRLPHDLQKDAFMGTCPFHGDCWEGMTAGPAMERRWGQPAQNLPLDHPAWDLEAHYIALGLMNLICTLSPERLILGGGVMGQPHLFPLVRQKVLTLLNGYVQSPAILQHIDDYIVPPALGNQAGVLGAFALGMAALA